jgi:hypothetical protein
MPFHFLRLDLWQVWNYLLASAMSYSTFTFFISCTLLLSHVTGTVVKVALNAPYRKHVTLLDVSKNLVSFYCSNQRSGEAILAFMSSNVDQKE